MGKPVKIHKKKSFMFTTRHYSFMSLMGVAVGIVCVVSGIVMLVQSFREAGNIHRGYGGAGLFCAALCVIGIICGARSLNERDIYIVPAIVAIVVNAAVLLWWVVMIVLSSIAG